MRVAGSQAWMISEESGLGWFELLTEELKLNDVSALFHTRVLAKMDEFFDRQEHLTYLGIK